MILGLTMEENFQSLKLVRGFLEGTLGKPFGARIGPTRSLDGDCGAEASSSTVSWEVNMDCYPPDQDPSLSSPWGDDDDDEATSV